MNAFRRLMVGLVLVLLAPASWAQCANAATPSCQVYTSCFAKQCPCKGDADEYFENYGAKYCKRFLDNAAFSTAGRKWRDKTLVCLQEAIVPQLDLSANPACNCKQMRNVAFKSHVDCYTQPGSSICDLPMADVKAIAQTVDAKDAFTIDGGKQMAAVAAVCVAKSADAARKAAWKAIQDAAKLP